METSRQHWPKQSRLGPQWKVKESSSVMRGQSERMLRGASASSQVTVVLLWIGKDVVLEIVGGPDRQRAGLAGFRNQAAAVGSGNIELRSHPGPAAHVVRAIVVETDELVIPAPTAALGIGPAAHRGSAVRTTHLGSWCHGFFWTG